MLKLTVRQRGKTRTTAERIRVERRQVSALKQRHGRSAMRALSALRKGLYKAMSGESKLARAAVNSAQGLARGLNVTLFKRKRGVRLTPRNTQVITRIAARYWAATRGTVLVTSATRSPRSQAQALYAKRRAGGKIVGLYRNRAAAREVEAAYQAGRKARQGRRSIINRMTQVLKNQVSRGIYLSAHMRDGAIDLRSRHLNRSQRRALQDAARAEGARALFEAHPPHLHLDLRKALP